MEWFLPLGNSGIKTNDKLQQVKRNYIQAGPRGHRLMTIILSILNQFKNFFPVRFFDKFAVKWILKIPPHLAYVATLPCETLMSPKQANYDKLQGSVATYLRCTGLLITKLRIIAESEWNFFQSVNIWQSYKQERDCLVHLCTWPTHC